MSLLDRVRERLGGTPSESPPPPPDRGQWGEARAAEWLHAHGFRILGRRVRVGDRDEFDLVAREGDALVFVEVKTRRSEAYGAPRDAVDRKKRHALSRAAVRYLRRLPSPNVNFRFDVVEVVGRIDGERPPIIRHIPNAFPLERRYDLPR